MAFTRVQDVLCNCLYCEWRNAAGRWVLRIAKHFFWYLTLRYFYFLTLHSLLLPQQCSFSPSLKSAWHYACILVVRGKRYQLQSRSVPRATLCIPGFTFSHMRLHPRKSQAKGTLGAAADQQIKASSLWQGLFFSLVSCSPNVVKCAVGSNPQG